MRGREREQESLSQSVDPGLVGREQTAERTLKEAAMAAQMANNRDSFGLPQCGTARLNTD